MVQLLVQCGWLSTVCMCSTGRCIGSPTTARVATVGTWVGHGGCYLRIGVCVLWYARWLAQRCVGLLHGTHSSQLHKGRQAGRQRANVLGGPCAQRAVAQGTPADLAVG